MSIFFSLIYLTQYSLAEGPQGEAKQFFPKTSRLSIVKAPLLIVFLHPKCSCSSATLSELENLLPQLDNRANVKVIFSFSGTDGLIKQTSLWKKANALGHGVQVLIDSSLYEANLFGAKTSGQTYLYDQNGQLIFFGGLTSARGHMGSSIGQEAIINFFNQNIITTDYAKVFGCLLLTEHK
jgi:hypothetical protein